MISNLLRGSAPRRPLRSLLLLFAFLALPAALLSACGGDADEDTAETTEAETAAEETEEATTDEDGAFRFDGVLIGGDFNAPARSPSFDPLRARTQDAWRTAGRGWPGTVTARLPVSRFDAIWVSPKRQVLACEHLALGVSDHRVVRTKVR